MKLTSLDRWLGTTEKETQKKITVEAKAGKGKIKKKRGGENSEPPQVKKNPLFGSGGVRKKEKNEG